MDRALSWQPPGIDLAAEQRFTLGSTSIDPASRDACFPGGRERLRPQDLKVLVVLARHRGDVVSRGQLVDLCWDGRIIGDDVINQCVSRLRSFAERSGGFSIETVPKSGYRIVEKGDARPRGRRRPVVLAAMLLAAGIFMAITLGRQDRQSSPPTPSIEILPFDQSGPGARDLAQATRSALSHSLSEGGFPVRLSGVPEKAQLIVSGDVAELGDAVRATVRVELPSSRTILYSQQFEASGADASNLPERIGAQVGAALSWTGALMALDRRHPTDPAITAQLLKKTAMSVQGGDPLQLYEMSRDLASKAPDSAIAQLGLAFETGFALEQIPLDQRVSAVAAARRAADRARELAPEFGDTYAPWCTLHSRIRFAECEDRLRAGIRADPGASFLSTFLSAELDNVGRFDEALELARMSLANDRYKLAKLVRLIGALEVKGRSGEAESLFRQAARWWPDRPGLATNRMAGMTERGDFAAAGRFGKQVGLPQALPAGLDAAIAAKDARAARMSCPLEADPSMASIYCMLGLATVGDIDGAFAFADRLYPRLHGSSASEDDRLWLQSPGKPPFGILASPAAQSMRRDRRFLALAERTGLLAYWRSGRFPDFCRGPAPEQICASLRRR